MRIKHQLNVGFGILVGTLAIVAGLSVWSLSHTQYTSVHLDNAFGQQRQLSQLLTSLNQQMWELSEYVMTEETDELEGFHLYKQKVLTEFDTWKQSILNERNHFDDRSLIRTSKEMEAWQRCYEQYVDMTAICEQVVELIQSDQGLQAIDLMTQQVEILYDEIVFKTIQDIIHEEDTEIADVHQAMWQLYGRIWYLTAIVIIIALTCAVLASRLVTRSITQPLATLGEAATHIGQGHFDVEIDVTSDDDFGELAATFRQMTRQLKQSTVSINDLRREVDQRQHMEKQLEAINEELTHFAYIISHDLKAPLRGIKLIADWLCTDYADKLGQEAAKQLALLQNRVQRMHNLIDSVLQYSRIGRIKQEITTIDLNELIESIIDNIAPPEHIQVMIPQPLPTVTGEKTQFTQVFQNLISNAIKYMDKPQGQITVACDDGPDAWTFSVSDNGPGIEAKHFDRIFQIFQTLASKDEYESTGVGLTLVKKIVEYHGGRVWIASEVGQGSTFYFSLPKQRTPEPPESSDTTGDTDEKLDLQNDSSGPVSDPVGSPAEERTIQ